MAQSHELRPGRRSPLAQRRTPSNHRVVERDPVIYREEMLTVMGVLGDIRHELIRIRQELADDGEEETEEDA